MAAAARELEELRREIDSLDDSIHDLVMRRAEIVARIGPLKPDAGTIYRPGREAALLRRLLARHRGPLPPASLARVYRELLGAMIGMQGRFTVAVCRPESDPHLWEPARLHYGAQAPMAAFGSPAQVIDQVSRGRASVGVLPLPRDDDPEPWWPSLARADVETPLVCARLPFAGDGDAGGRAAGALAVAMTEPDPSGDDRSLLALAGAADASRARFRDVLAGTDLDPAMLLESPDPGRPGEVLRLIDVTGIVGADDARLAALGESLGPALRRVVRVGGYAVPHAAAARR